MPYGSEAIDPLVGQQIASGAEAAGLGGGGSALSSLFGQAGGALGPIGFFASMIPGIIDMFRHPEMPTKEQTLMQGFSSPNDLMNFMNQQPPSIPLKPGESIVHGELGNNGPRGRNGLPLNPNQTFNPNEGQGNYYIAGPGNTGPGTPFPGGPGSNPDAHGTYTPLPGEASMRISGRNDELGTFFGGAPDPFTLDRNTGQFVRNQNPLLSMGQSPATDINPNSPPQNINMPQDIKSEMQGAPQMPSMGGSQGGGQGFGQGIGQGIGQGLNQLFQGPQTGPGNPTAPGQNPRFPQQPQQQNPMNMMFGQQQGSFGPGFGQTGSPSPSGSTQQGIGSPLTNVGLGAGIPNSGGQQNGQQGMGQQGGQQQGGQGNQQMEMNPMQSGFWFPSFKF